jgi:RHS repeat-associated protein
MCPGIAVLGGGGAGGDGDGSGDGGKDGSGGNGKGDGKGGKGDGKNGSSSSGKCGAGSGKCPKPHGQKGTAAAGDPVDIATGRVFTELVCDLYLPGWIPLTFARTYNSAASERDVGLGYGWGHTFAWEVIVKRRAIELRKGDQTVVHFSSLVEGAEARGAGDWILRRDVAGFTLDTGDGRWRTFHQASEGQNSYLLTAVRDGNGNEIRLEHEGGLLARILDSVGRTVEVRRDRARRIEALVVPHVEAQSTITFTAYRHDEHGDLVEARDADGFATRYSYEDHLLASQAHPTGITFYYVYDRARRCVETWGAHQEGKDPALADDVPDLLADGRTRAKGSYHVKLNYHDDGYVEVVNSLGIERYFVNGAGTMDKEVTSSGAVHSRHYDERGNVVAYTDPSELTTTWERDDRGRILRYTDPLDRSFTIERDAHGRATKITDPAGFSEQVWYDDRGNLLGSADALGGVIAYRYGSHGECVEIVLPNGGRTIMDYDDHGNRVRVVEPDGGVKSIGYDSLGRTVWETDAMGATTRYQRSLFGTVLAAALPSGGVTRYHGVQGLVLEEAYPDGTSTRFRHGGLRQLCDVQKPNGETIRFRYNREGSLVAIKNEAGETHRFLLNAAGHLIEERTFDDRSTRFRNDAAGRLVWYEAGLGGKTERTYDAGDQLTERVYPDGTADRFVYDVRGYAVEANNDDVEVRFEYDALGRIVRESQTIDGETHVVEIGYDLLGKRVRRATSLGHEEAWARDAAGSPSRVLLRGRDEVGFQVDAHGREICRTLPGGARIVSRYDLQAEQLVERYVAKPASEGAIGQPDWVGGPVDRTVSKTFAHSPIGLLTERSDQGRGVTRYEYDRAGQLTAVRDGTGKDEIYHYDVTGNLLDSGAPRAVGNRINARGSSSYTYDDEGRIIERRASAGSGAETVWSYDWLGSGMLGQARCSDGRRVELVYDAVGRRVRKRSSRRGEYGTDVLEAETRFVWDGNAVVHEIVRRPDQQTGEVRTTERTYCYEGGTMAPWAHFTRTSGGGSEHEEEGWHYYVNDPVGTPEELVDGAGRVEARLRRTAFGETRREGAPGESTPLRFQGQHEDEETGLHYNRFRYYDPELGRYLSPDPVSVLGGLNPYRYAINCPTCLIDPFGLSVTAQLNAKDNNTNKKGNPVPNQTYDPKRTSGNGVDADPHPIVQQDMAHENLVPKVDRLPGTCAEPKVTSDYLKDWENRNRDRLKREGKDIPDKGPYLHKNPELAKEALGGVTSIQPRTKDAGVDANGKPLAPGDAVACCSNCQVLMNNLVERGLPAATINPAGGPKLKEG